MAILGRGSNRSNGGGVLQRRRDEQREESKQNLLRSAPDMWNQIQNPLQGIKERYSIEQPQPQPQPQPIDAKSQWVEQRLEMDRKNTQKNKVMQTINEFLEPVSRQVYKAQANIPGLASFQKGAGDTLGVETFTAPAGNNGFDKVAELVGNIAGGVVNPTNLSQGLVKAPLEAGRSVAQSLAGRSSILANKYAQRGIEGAVAGGMQSAVISGARGDTDLDKMATNVGLGVGLGAAADIALVGLSDAAKSIINKYRPAKPSVNPDTLALPAPRERGNINRANPDDVISPEYTFGLPEPSSKSVKMKNNISEGRRDLKVLDDEIRQLEASYERAIVDEYNYLKQSLKERGGVKQGQLQQDVTGNVTGRTGRMSNNPLWYQEFHAANKKVPNNKELYALARDRVDNGFRDETGDIAGWKIQNNYDESMSALRGVRENLDQSLKELDPAIHVTDMPIVSNELSFAPKEKSVPNSVTNYVDEVTNVNNIRTQPTVELPNSPTMAPADQSSGIAALGKQKKYTDPTDTRTYIVSKTDKEPFDFKKLTEDFYTKNVDSLQSLNKFDKYVERQTGKKLSADERSYYLALNSKGADMTSNHILTERLVDSKGNVIGSSLRDITSQIPSNPTTYTHFMDYLIARHAPTRMLRGEKVYNRKTKMTPELAEAKVMDYERTYPEFKQIAEDLDQWNQQLGQAWLVDTGIVPQHVFDSWRTENPFWIPNQRKFTDLEKRVQTTGANKSFGNQRNPVKKYNKEGSERPIIDPIESLIEYTDRYVKTARRNEVMQSLYRNVEKSPGDFEGFATIIKKEPIDNKVLDGDGLANTIDQLDKEFQSIMGSKIDKTKLDKDNVVSTLIDGERVHMKIDDPDLLDAIMNLNPQASNAVIEIARKATNTMKLLTTGNNPIFGLTRNIFRDIPEGYIFSKTTNNPFRYAWDTLESFVSVFADGALGGINNSRMAQKVTPESFKTFLSNQAKLYKDFKAIGGGHSSPAAADRNLLAQSKRSVLPQQNKGVNIGKKAWNALENLNNALESGPRMGEFKRIRKKEGDSYASKVRGLFEAQDLTTNFKRSGKVVKDLDAVFPYMNAAVQGLDKFARSFKDQPAQVLGKAISMISLPTIALYAYNYDNPDYQKLSNHTKDNFWLVPTTDQKFIKIAKPRELSVPFSGLLERAMRAWNEADPDAFKDFANTAATMFVPPGMPIQELAEGEFAEAAIKPVRDTIAGPLVDIAMNKNFADSPIVPGYLQGGSPRYQHDANTSEVSKYIGDLMNVSPKQLDHLIRSYTGVIGQVALPATTQGTSFGETMTKQMTADSVFSTDVSKRFYELKEKLDGQYTDAKRTGEAPKGYDDEARKYLDRVSTQMSDFTKVMREIDKSNLSKEEKKDYKRQLTEQRNELARIAYESVRDALKATSK